MTDKSHQWGWKLCEDILEKRGMERRPSWVKGICDSGVGVVRTVRKWGYSYFVAMELWCLGASDVRTGVTEKGLVNFFGWWTRLLWCGCGCVCVSIHVFILKDISMWIALKVGGCQSANGYSISPFPCCKALNESNYVVSLTAFIISSVFELA